MQFPHGRGGKRTVVITLANKVSKSDADYVNYSRKKHCEDCNMFTAPGTCSKVQGAVNMVGTCRFWGAKDALLVE